MNFLDDLEIVFSGRVFPEVVCSVAGVSKDELEEVESFCSSACDGLSVDLLEFYFDVVCLLSPDAFIYFLPKIIRCSVDEGCPGLLVNQSFVRMLDRSPDPEMWDDFFISRWAVLSKDECGVIEEWLLWLAASDPELYSDASIDRALGTISLIKTKPGRAGRDPR